MSEKGTVIAQSIIQVFAVLFVMWGLAHANDVETNNDSLLQALLNDYTKVLGEPNAFKQALAGTPACLTACKKHQQPPVVIEAPASSSDILRILMNTKFGFVNDANNRWKALERVDNVIASVGLENISLTEKDTNYLIEDFLVFLLETKEASGKSFSHAFALIEKADAAHVESICGDNSHYVNQAELLRTPNGTETVYTKVCVEASNTPLSEEKAANFGIDLRNDGNPPNEEAFDYETFKANVFGRDDRVLMTSPEYPWSTIGTFGRIMCTGTLIAPHLVVTAAHCVTEDYKNLNPDLNVFVTGYVDGWGDNGSYIDRVWWGRYRNTDHTRRFDWAIIQLEDSIGYQQGWLAVDHYTVKNFPSKITLAGFSGDVYDGAVASVHENCSTRRRYIEQGVIYHDCDSDKGSSGGPILHYGTDGVTVVGVHVGQAAPSYKKGNHRFDTYIDIHANIATTSSEFWNTLVKISSGSS